MRRSPSNPMGPVRSDLGLAVEDFFWEPYYQLLRQADAGLAYGEATRGRRRYRARPAPVRRPPTAPWKVVTAPKLRAFGPYPS
ncbi:MAG: hypothetical protein KL863_27585 [Rhizobium sp.]|nr:hypothetical protein [Rhizobium sp.]